MEFSHGSFLAAPSSTQWADLRLFKSLAYSSIQNYLNNSSVVEKWVYVVFFA